MPSSGEVKGEMQEILMWSFYLPTFSPLSCLFQQCVSLYVYFTGMLHDDHLIGMRNLFMASMTDTKKSLFFHKLTIIKCERSSHGRASRYFYEHFAVEWVRNGETRSYLSQPTKFHREEERRRRMSLQTGRKEIEIRPTTSFWPLLPLTHSSTFFTSGKTCKKVICAAGLKEQQQYQTRK